MPNCWHCKAERSAAHYDRVVHNKHALHAEWAGWRMSGRFLIAPSRAGRITPERLLGMLWEESARRSALAKNSQNRRSPLVQIQRSENLPARERFDGQA